MQLSNDPREWFDWQRVLLAWRYRYSRTGLTPHCLATLCARPPEDVLSEIMDDGSGRPQFCGTIRSPILSMSFRNGPNVYPFEPYIITEGGMRNAYSTQFFSFDHWDPCPEYLKGYSPYTWDTMVDRLLTKYPWPKYKSTGGMVGRETTGLQSLEFILSQIALGKVAPFDSEVFKDLFKKDNE